MKAFLTSRMTVAVVLTALLVFTSNTSAVACAACWNPAGSDKMNNAATVGIFAMVVIMFVMLGAVAGFGWYLSYRAKHPLPDYEELLNDENPEPSPGPAH